MLSRFHTREAGTGGLRGVRSPLTLLTQGGPAHWFEETREVGLAQTLELDLELTRGIDRDGDRRALAVALVTFRRSGYTVVAEGIETKDELEAAT